MIHFDIVDGKIRNLVFDGGCPGNTTGLSRLLEGADAEETAEKLLGTPCGMRGTSCPDQLARALRKALGKD